MLRVQGLNAIESGALDMQQRIAIIFRSGVRLPENLLEELPAASEYCINPLRWAVRLDKCTGGDDHL
jgi:hypothetical protein